MIKPRSSSLAPCINVTVDNCSISPSPQVKSLGVIFDSVHSFQEHISNITGSSYFHLHNINHLCPSYVDYTLIDYFNSLLFGLALKSIHKLQQVQNFGACITRSLLRLSFSSSIGFQLTIVMISNFCSSPLWEPITSFCSTSPKCH